jgi:type IV pilus assembly protein PilA
VRNAISTLRTRRDGDERGFTLIELMVVVLIIAILIAIAIPTFLGARERAQDKAAESSLRNGLTAAKTIYTDQEDYGQAVPSATNTQLATTEPSLTFVPGATVSTDPKTVSVASTAANLIVLASASKSGRCFWIRDNTQGPGTEFGSTPKGSATACKATSDPGNWTGAGFP